MDYPILKNEKECVGCYACLSVCPKEAISMLKVGFEAQKPHIDVVKCIKCKKCEQVCQYQSKKQDYTKRAYVVVNKNIDMIKKSASGGAFSAAAEYILKNGGMVVGAVMSFTPTGVVAKHECINSIEELPKILGSKYVHSDCSQAYPLIKQALCENRKVLFGGTSCQVKALKAYLQSIDTINLYTIDLICHGVPSIGFLNKYVEYIENKHKGKVKDLSFRSKVDGQIKYELSFTLIRHSSGKEKVVKIPLRKSSYYRMFMGAESYQEACYQCEFSSIDKPADITVGDYFEIKNDYPELLAGENAIKTDLGVSCMIVHSEKGFLLMDELTSSLDCREVEVHKVVKSHAQLQNPSKWHDRERILKKYRSEGIVGLEHFYRRKNFFDWKENLSVLVGKKNIRRIKFLTKCTLKKDGF